jgi:hypothetical protein
MATQMTARELEMYGCMTMQPEHQPTNDGYRDEMAGCTGDTYVDKKVDLLHQLGYPNITVDIFADCKSESEIDRRARSIMFA